MATTLALALAATACGGGIDVGDVGTTTDTATDTDRPTVAAVEPTAVVAEPTATPVEPTPEPAVGSIQDVAAATVKISAQGTFVPPLELEQFSSAGIGSGFVIDESGLMVTNNHVVAGAAIIEIYFDGSTEPLNARLLGVSECSDLAVLDIEGDGYEFLEFRDTLDGVSPGLPIFAAGYPLNLDTDFFAVDYTLTAGIVSTTQAGGETNWASVDGVIEHDARIRGGNSGGPLVDEQGRVVGINYAGEDTNDLNSAIDALAALETIEALKNGDVESLGINGQAIVLDDGLSGVWVSGVASGSPADQAGVLPGDLITTMETLPLAVNGTLEEYCDIIRTNGPTDTLSIEVVRIGTEEVLTGQINGTPLAQSFSFAAELGDETADSPSGQVAGAYENYEFVSDDTGSVGVEVPAEWIDRNGEPNPEFGESIFAAPDLAGFTETWDVPGVIVERSTSLTSADIDSVLDVWAELDCADRSGRETFETDDGVFTGKWEVFTQCGSTETAALTIAVSPPDGNSVVRMFVQIVTDADLEAADRAIASFDAVS
jgi:serine protease Do